MLPLTTTQLHLALATLAVASGAASGHPRGLASGLAVAAALVAVTALRSSAGRWLGSPLPVGPSATVRGRVLPAPQHAHALHPAGTARQRAAG